MNRTPVSSSNVASVGYDPHTMTLEVEFVKGSVYHYFDVPQSVYDAMMSAASIGSFLNQHIKGSYRDAKV
jgi:hypothetical protein